ncbi:hypothetical protein HZC20_02995 [Candidatus Peregrinibacteria bacterium]|nr:hypothetical protein [Candidatus Peregrinibacteria bacterium]
MADTTTLQAGQVQTASSTGIAAGDGIIVDKNKPAAQYLKEVESKYIVPKLVREKFPDLIKLIYETESMNEEEREYWLQIMPIMTEDQIGKFRTILINEKDQLAKLDQEYSTNVSSSGMPSNLGEIDEVKMKEKFKEIREGEGKSKEEDKKAEEELLKQIENL